MTPVTIQEQESATNSRLIALHGGPTACPSVRPIATSRERLGVRAEPASGVRFTCHRAVLSCAILFTPCKDDAGGLHEAKSFLGRSFHSRTVRGERRRRFGTPGNGPLDFFGRGWRCCVGGVHLAPVVHLRAMSCSHKWLNPQIRREGSHGRSV
jgi:hypothetical protein